MTELTRDWEREIRAAARSIWHRGYNDVLTQIIAAARAVERGEVGNIYIQRTPWNDERAYEDQADLERAYVDDILGLLDCALTYGVMIEFEDRFYTYEVASREATSENS